MKVFRELTIRGKPDAIQETLSYITGALNEGWERNKQAEETVRSVAGNPVYCFSCSETDNRPAADLWLDQKNPEELAVSNIVPRTKPRLDYDEYNLVLQEFYDRFVSAATRRTRVTARLSKDDVSLEHWVTPDTAGLLRTFSTSANRSTGSHHPLDMGRWLDFVAATHREGSRLDPGTLRRWLEEVEGWPAEQAQDLAVNYETTRSLFAYYDHRS
jgi:hypothetical protein